MERTVRWAYKWVTWLAFNYRDCRNTDGVIVSLVGMFYFGMNLHLPKKSHIFEGGGS